MLKTPACALCPDACPGVEGAQTSAGAGSIPGASVTLASAPSRVLPRGEYPPPVERAFPQQAAVPVPA